MRDKQRAETRRRLYHAALEVFARDGVDSCRIEDITQLAEVSRAAFYFHFPTKDDVLFELLRESEQPTEEALLALPPNAPLTEAFDVFVRGMVSFWHPPPRQKVLIDVFAAQMRRLRVLTQDPKAEPVRALIATRFQLAAQRGELSEIVPAELLADFFLLNCFAALASWGVQPVLPLEETLRGVVTLFLQGAGAK